MGSGLSSPSGSEPVATDSLSPHLSPVAPVKATLAGSPSPPRPPPAKPQLEGPTEAELFASSFTEDVIDCCFLSADDVRARLEVQRTKRVSIGGDRTVDYGAVCMRGLYPSDLDKVRPPPPPVPPSTPNPPRSPARTPSASRRPRARTGS